MMLKLDEDGAKSSFCTKAAFFREKRKCGSIETLCKRVLLSCCGVCCFFSIKTLEKLFV